MPTLPPKPNRFQGLSLGELYEACQVRASTLLGLDRGRDTRERTNLAEDTAHLLLAVAPALVKDDQVLGTPAKAIFLGSEEFLPAFLTAHEFELRQVRYRTLIAASDLAYGRRAEQWLREGTLSDGEPVYDLAIASEQGLALVLAHLELVYKTHRKPTALCRTP